MLVARIIITVIVILFFGACIAGGYAGWKSGWDFDRLLKQCIDDGKKEYQCRNIIR